MGPDRHMKLIGMWSRGELACSEEFLIALGSGVRPGRVLSHNGVRYSILATTIPYDDTRAAWRKRLCAVIPPKNHTTVAFDDRRAARDHAALRMSWLKSQRAGLRLAKDGEAA